jgi:hypothetical protein
MKEVLLKLFLLLLTIPLFFLGCAPTQMHTTSALEPQKLAEVFRNAEPNIPPLSSDRSRIFFYRPQRFLGSAGNFVININDNFIVAEDNVTKSFFIPGSVFIVDSPVSPNKTSLFLNKKEKMKLDLSNERGETKYLRLQLKATSAYLEITEKDLAEKEIQSLKLTGYFILSDDLKRVCQVPVPISNPNFIAIERKQEAYTVFAAITNEQFNKIMTEASNNDKIEVVKWENFNQNIDKFVKSQIIKDEYLESRAVEGIEELLFRYQALPFGLTWNGGIAFTRMDYNHAINTYQKYKANSNESNIFKTQDPRADPVNPQNHLGPLLCW